MRIGVFGGAFDPIHYGHLILAEESREQARLDQVWFIPAPRHPFKIETTEAPYEDRVAMLHTAIDSNAAFRINEIEKDRPGLSYTADTLAELGRLHPGNELFLLVGSDTLPDFPRWHDPKRIVRTAALVVRERPGHPVIPEATLHDAIGLPADEKLRMQVISVPLIDLSSRDIRRRVGKGRSIRYMLPPEVEAYIARHQLYVRE